MFFHNLFRKQIDFRRSINGSCGGGASAAAKTSEPGRSGVRRENGRCGGGCGGESAPAKTNQQGLYDKESSEKLETAKRGATPRPRPWWPTSAS